MEHSLVSVIVPCYNGERYIERCIESIYIQEWPEIQLIVVDDGSTDKSAKKILSWQNAFKKKGWDLQYVYQENTGLGAAISRGLKEVKGQYLTLLDADDRFLQGAVRKKAEYLDGHPDCPCVRNNGWVVRGENTRWLFVQEKEEKQNTDVFTALLEGRTNNWAGSYMIRTKKLFEFYPDRNIYPSRFGQNLQILLPVTQNEHCAFIDEPLMEYIQMTDSLSREKEQEKAKQKSIRNAEGYYDIRLHMINILNMSNEEKEKWRKEARSILERSKMNIAVEYQDINLLKEAWSSIKNEHGQTLDDRIVYWTVVFQPISFVFRFFRKLKIVVKARRYD